MKSKRRFNVVRIKRSDLLNQYGTMMILTALFVCGVIIGAFIIKNNNELIMSKISQIFTGYQIKRGSQSMLETFANSMLMNMIFLAASFMFGMCCIGAPGVCILPLTRGLSMGVTAAYLYSTYALNGVGYFVLTILPGAAISITLLLISCNESYKTSLDLLKMISAGQQMKSGLLKRYLTVYPIIIGLSAAGSLADMIMARVFSSLFAL